MDASLYRAVNRLAARTGWAHPLVVAYATYGVLLFTALLLAGWWLARRSAETDAVTAVVWAGAGLLLAHRRLGVLAAVLAVVMAFARVYVVAHYPGDVAAESP
jgi:membrane-associated phospholipid phosphatase